MILNSSGLRYSIWLDSKLRLQRDPLQLLDYFLWRKGHEYAISNHYDRHCVWEEVAQNKKLNKYNHTVIDEQFEFYQADGLKKFNSSDPNKLLPSSKFVKDTHSSILRCLESHACTQMHICLKVLWQFELPILFVMFAMHVCRCA